jgi:alpha-mannosidase
MASAAVAKRDALGASPETVQPVSYSRMRRPRGSLWASYENNIGARSHAHSSTAWKKKTAALWPAPNSVKLLGSDDE